MLAGIKYSIRQRTGLNAWKWRHLPKGLYCFNYHRIGDPSATQFDPNVFSCTEHRFDEHIRFCKEHFKVINIGDLITLINERKPLRDHVALITFDDGYFDNYELAFPILKSHRCPAVFFIASDYVDGQVIPWWDEIAWMVNNTEMDEVALPGMREPISLKGENRKLTIRRVLNLVKSDVSRTIHEKLAILRDALCCEYSTNGSRANLFMNWEQVVEMCREGMDIGSHTVSHRILSHLDEADQQHEVSKSKQQIEARIGSAVEAFAYPVGGFNSFTDTTRRLLEQHQYKVSFTFVSGVNVSPWEYRYQLFRFPVTENSGIPQLKYLISHPPNKR